MLVKFATASVLLAATVNGYWLPTTPEAGNQAPIGQDAPSTQGPILATTQGYQHDENAAAAYWAERVKIASNGPNGLPAVSNTVATTGAAGSGIPSADAPSYGSSASSSAAPISNQVLPTTAASFVSQTSTAASATPAVGMDVSQGISGDSYSTTASQTSQTTAAPQMDVTQGSSAYASSAPLVSETSTAALGTTPAIGMDISQGISGDAAPATSQMSSPTTEADSQAYGSSVAPLGQPTQAPQMDATQGISASSYASSAAPIVSETSTVTLGTTPVSQMPSATTEAYGSTAAPLGQPITQAPQMDAAQGTSASSYASSSAPIGQTSATTEAMDLPQELSSSYESTPISQPTTAPATVGMDLSQEFSSTAAYAATPAADSGMGSPDLLASNGASSTEATATTTTGALVTPQTGYNAPQHFHGNAVQSDNIASSTSAIPATTPAAPSWTSASTIAPQQNQAVPSSSMTPRASYGSEGQVVADIPTSTTTAPQNILAPGASRPY